MQEYVEDNPITFNDIPRVMSDIIKLARFRMDLGRIM